MKNGKRHLACGACILALLVALVATPSAQAQTFKTVHSFDKTDGAFPAGLIQATDGNLYGTTAGGGANNSCSFGCGTVFKTTPGGTVKSLYSFCFESDCMDGHGPVAGLFQATDGNYYGTTEFEGANDEGTVFKITPTGTLTTLYSFCSQSNCADGRQPVTGLIQGTDGNFYGTTAFGGANNSNTCANLGCGTIFKITPSGTLTTLYNFCSPNGCTDGRSPLAGLASRRPMGTFTAQLVGVVPAASTVLAQFSNSRQTGP